VLASAAGQQYLATTQDKGIRRTQSGLKLLALIFGYRTYK
jgi:hypothetical protein